VQYVKKIEEDMWKEDENYEDIEPTIIQLRESSSDDEVQAVEIDTDSLKPLP
jgi:hypothetical protein